MLLGFLVGKKMGSKCKNCQCDCHCNNELHVPNENLDNGDLCVCDDCACKSSSEDKTFENETKLDEEAFNGA